MNKIFKNEEKKKIQEEKNIKNIIIESEKYDDIHKKLNSYEIKNEKKYLKENIIIESIENLILYSVCDSEEKQNEIIDIGNEYKNYYEENITILEKKKIKKLITKEIVKEKETYEEERQYFIKLEKKDNEVNYTFEEFEKIIKNEKLYKSLFENTFTKLIENVEVSEKDIINKNVATKIKDELKNFETDDLAEKLNNEYINNERIKYKKIKEKVEAYKINFLKNFKIFYLDFINHIKNLSNSEKTIIYDNIFNCGYKFTIVEEKIKEEEEEIKIKKENKNNRISIIETGSKCNQLKYKGVTLIDSLNFFGCALSCLPETYGLNELKKGYFCHKFNSENNEHQNYNGILPGISWYEPHRMKNNNNNCYGDSGDYEYEYLYYPEKYNDEEIKEFEKKLNNKINTLCDKCDKCEFIKWHISQVKNKYIFNFKKDLVDYCKSDVDILHRSCAIFLTSFEKLYKDYYYENCELPGINDQHIIKLKKEGALNEEEIKKYCIGVPLPFQKTTLPGFAYDTFVYMFMPEKSMEIENNKTHFYSKISQDWLNYIEIQRNIKIEREKPINCGEKLKYADGYYEDKKGIKKVFLFNGCFWAGCTKCYNQHDRNQILNCSMKDLNYNRDQEIKLYESFNYSVEVIRECDFIREYNNYSDEDKKNLEEIKEFSPNHCIDIRSSYFGGNTNVFKPYYQADIKNDEVISYYDVNSEYPAVMFLKYFPTGKSKIIRECKNNDINDFFGFVYCKVKMLNYSNLPVLPGKFNGKLSFNNNTKLGVWTTEELKKAIELEQVEIEKIYEVQHYEKKTKNIFYEYIRYFYKLKCENSIKDNMTDKEKSDLIESCKLIGIELDINKFCYNPVICAICKLMLNSLYGKLAQRSNMMSTEIIKFDNRKRLYEILYDSTNEVSNVLIIDNNTIRVKFSKIKEFDNYNIFKTNVAVASWVTSQARLLLYSYMEKIGTENLIYCDTDSIIFKHKINKCPLENSLVLGDMKNELIDKKKVTWIMYEFVSTGPKSYSYYSAKEKYFIEYKNGNIKKCITTDNELFREVLKSQNIFLSLEDINNISIFDKEEFINNYDDYILLKMISKIELKSKGFRLNEESKNQINFSNMVKMVFHEYTKKEEENKISLEVKQMQFLQDQKRINAILIKDNQKKLYKNTMDKRIVYKNDIDYCAPNQKYKFKIGENNYEYNIKAINTHAI